MTQHIADKLAKNPIVAILGPRQVGKTTLALDVAKAQPSVYLDLEDPSDFQKINNPAYYFEMHADRLIILDEVQRYPDLFVFLRGVVDARRREGRGNGRFLLLGSASNALLQQNAESLAGRIAYLELAGLNPFEMGGDTSAVRKLWLRGGFPRSYLADSDRDSDAWRKDFIRTYVERDIPQLGPRIPATTLMRFWTLLAHVQGECFHAVKLAQSLGVSSMTVSRYLRLMVDLLLVRRLEPWYANGKKRLVKSPRIYIRDSGLLHSLHRAVNFDDLLGNPVVGKSFEGFVIEQVISRLPYGVQAFFYRSLAGAEIDLVLAMPGQQLWAIEIKLSLTPTLSKGFYLACEDLAVTRRLVVYPGQDTYRLGDGVQVLSLPLLLETLDAALTQDLPS